jgi:hypothetical protein
MDEIGFYLVASSFVVFVVAFAMAVISPAKETSLDIGANPLVRPMFRLAAILFVAGLFLIVIPALLRLPAMVLLVAFFLAWLMSLQDRVRRLEEHVRAEGEQK